MNSGLTVKVNLSILFVSSACAYAQVANVSKTCAPNPVQAHITVVAEPSAAQGEKAHEKLAAASEELTPLQVQRLAANARMYKEKVRPLQAELRLDKRRLMDTLTDEDVSVPHAQLLQSKISLLKAEIRDLQLKKQLADSVILTANQRKALRGQLSQHSSDQHKILALSGKSVQ